MFNSDDENDLPVRRGLFFDRSNENNTITYNNNNNVPMDIDPLDYTKEEALLVNALDQVVPPKCPEDELSEAQLTQKTHVGKVLLSENNNNNNSYNNNEITGRHDSYDDVSLYDSLEDRENTRQSNKLNSDKSNNTMQLSDTEHQELQNAGESIKRKILISNEDNEETSKKPRNGLFQTMRKIDTELPSVKKNSFDRSRKKH